MTFEDMKLSPIKKNIKKIEILNGIKLEVLQYLPINEKANFIQYIIDNSIDESTGCFSPIRLNVFYSLAIIKWYAGIDISNIADITEAYDKLETSLVVESVLGQIPSDERKFIDELLNETVKDISRFNNSFAGMVSIMNSDANNLGKTLEDILQKIRSKEGTQALAEVENMVGKD